MEFTSAHAPHFEGKVPHLLCAAEDIADIVLLPGDPGRVELFAQIFDDFAIVSRNREYTVGTGTYKGVKMSVCSTGIGAPSTEIAVIELIELGAKALVRVGGTGVIQPHIPCGDLIINTAAMRKGGASQFYAPPEYPAVASFEVVESLLKICKQEGRHVEKGICASVGSFFAGQGRSAAGRDFHDNGLIENYRRLGVLNLEMEAETIFTLGSLFHIYTGSICAVHCNRIKDQWLLDFQQAQIEVG
ncbi:MAG: nucleoside phosphorylase, partial [Candidatus Pelethousia sp.]|nr:nucleoside phosphorylase [Candidatus Pelethousia sp.]